MYYFILFTEIVQNFRSVVRTRRHNIIARMQRVRYMTGSIISVPRAEPRKNMLFSKSDVFGHDIIF